jgi:hypothetical protein
MRTAVATLKSVSSYSQSRVYDWEVEKLSGERPDEYEERTWRNKCHTMPPNGQVFIPPMAFKMSLDRAAQMLSMQIPGKGKKTFTAFFLSGVVAIDPVLLPMTKEEVKLDRIYANSDGKRGSGKRVWRNFPKIESWKSDVPFQVLADEITEEVFERHLKQAGTFVGIGRFRPENGGFYGRFSVEKIKW